MKETLSDELKLKKLTMELNETKEVVRALQDLVSALEKKLSEYKYYLSP